MEEASAESNNKEKEEKEEFNKEELEKDMKEIAKSILIKHLDGRKYEKEKLPKWTELILQDISLDLRKKYPEYAYGIVFYI